MSELAKWNLTVSSTTDADVRAFLAEHGGSDADLSRFVEQAVARQLLLKMTKDIHARNADADPNALIQLIDEELAEVRRNSHVDYESLADCASSSTPTSSSAR